MTSSVICGWTRVKVVGLGLALVVGILAGAFIAATPAGAIDPTFYVAPGTLGGGSCASPDYNTISAAVSHASSGDTIDVCPGTYAESVDVNNIQLTLNGSAGDSPATIDAAGQPEGVIIQGAAAAGSSVQGFNIENAQGEGVLVEGTSNVTVANNVVSGNDLACIPQTGANDCGEGIHLESVTNSTVSRNTSENNTGGILLDDGVPPAPSAPGLSGGRLRTTGRPRETRS